MMKPILITITCPNCLGRFTRDELAILKRDQRIECSFCGNMYFLNNDGLLDILPEEKESCWSSGVMDDPEKETVITKTRPSVVMVGCDEWCDEDSLAVKPMKSGMIVAVTGGGMLAIVLTVLVLTFFTLNLLG